MTEFLANYGLEIVCALVTAAALAICRGFNKRLKEYKNIVDAQEQAALETFVEKRLEPIYQELEDLRKYIRETEAKRDHNMNFIITPDIAKPIFCKFRRFIYFFCHILTPLI